MPASNAFASRRRSDSGASWEGFALEQVLRIAAPDEAYFWATHAGVELDLLLFKNGKRFGVEFKRADAPVLTRSMMLALTDLKLDHLTVIYPGNRPYAFAERITVPPLGSPAGCMGRPRPDPCTLTWFRE